MQETEQTTVGEEVTEQGQQSNQIYLDAIAKLKANTVSLDEYNKLKEDNDNLLKAVVEGNAATADVPERAKRPISDLRKELFTPERELNDIEYVTKALELRQRVLDETGEDCFVPKAHNYVPTNEAYTSAERTADVLQQCLDYANGDNQVFITELQRRLNDVRMPRR